MSQAHEIIHGVIAIFRSPNRFSDIYSAVNYKGHPVSPRDAAAAKYSLAGAWVANGHGYAPGPAMEAWAALSMAMMTLGAPADQAQALKIAETALQLV